MSAADTWHDLPEGLRAQALAGDQLVIVSAGIDIGSSTMHLALSRLVAERHDGGFDIVSRDVLYESPIMLTPYLEDDLIDAAAVEDAFGAHYREAGVDPTGIDTGVVILTGVALDRANARAIADLLAAWGGQFLAVAAGDHFEGVLAAHGSGAVEASTDGSCVLNVDIGGGTTKIAVCRDGTVHQVQAFDVGTRLIAWNADTRSVERLEPSGAALATRAGVAVAPGQVFTQADEEQLCGTVATSLTAALAGERTGPFLDTIRAERYEPFPPVDRVVFSGGFAEYLAGREHRDFGDLGPGIAAAVRRVSPPSLRQVTSAVGIRATAIGAGQFTVQVSGITIHRSDACPLPLRNIPVAALPEELLGVDDVRASAVASAVEERLGLLDGPQADATAIALTWRGPASYGRLCAVAAGLAAGAQARPDPTAPLVVVCDVDVARLLGRTLQAELGDDAPLLVVDGIAVSQLDFLDVGAPMGEHGAVPVTIKSLAFRGAVTVGG